MAESGTRNLRWYQGLTGYHWWVLVIGVMSWMFDCMDQRIFVLSRTPAIRELIDADGAGMEAAAQQARAQLDAEAAAGQVTAQAAANPELVRERAEALLTSRVNSYGDLVTALMVIGWSVGGFLFGIYGDKLGRVRTLSLAIGVYSIFTGLSGLAVGLVDFCIYRFIMGCGIGGAFATAATLIAETMPAHARAFALGLFQALSAVGNITGSAIALWVVSPDLKTNLFGLLPFEVSGWRLLFMVGVLPAILVVLIMRTVKEPEAWRAAQKSAADNLERQLGDLKSLFGTPRWRRNTFVGVSLAVIGVIGLWVVGFYSPELIGTALKDLSTEKVAWWKAAGTLVQDVGAFFGMLAFTLVATRMGRRMAFGGAFVFCWVIVSGVFLLLREPWHIMIMTPILGFATLSLFGGYSIYFPELYPTRLRATGTGFCYNVGRILAAMVILFKIPIREAVDKLRAPLDAMGLPETFRLVSIVLCTVYLLGLVVLIWAPETKGQPLPEED